MMGTDEPQAWRFTHYAYQVSRTKKMYFNIRLEKNVNQMGFLFEYLYEQMNHMNITLGLHITKISIFDT